jgi:multidrug transporter EmrE-like cation transporter
MSNKNIISCLILIVITSIISILLLKKFAIDGNKNYLILYLIFYSIYIQIYIKLLKDHDLSKIYPITKIINILLVVLFSVLIYNEKIDNYLIFGVLFGIISISLLLMRL